MSKSAVIRLSLFALFVLTLAVLAWCVGRFPQPDGAVELMFPASSPARTALEKERKVFESVTYDVITLQRATTEISDFKDRILELEDALLDLEGIAGFITPANRRFARAFALADDEFQHSRLLLKVDSTLTHANRVTLHNSLDRILTDFHDLAPKRVGALYTSVEITQGIVEELQQLLPWVLLSLVVVTALVMRSFVVAVVVVLSCGLSAACAILVFSLFGCGLGPVSQLAPALLLAVGGAFHLHFCFRICSDTSLESGELKAEIRRGIFWATLTTSVGILSLALLDMVDIVHFALLAGLGIWVQAYAACNLIPEEILKKESLEFRYRSSFSGEAIFTGVLVIVCAYLSSFIGRLEVDTDPKEFLPPGGKALSSISTAETRFPGNHYLSLLVEHESSDKNQMLQDSARLEELLGGVAEIVTIISPSGFEEQFSDVPRAFQLSPTTIPESFWAPKQKKSRLLLETPLEGQALLELGKKIKRTLREAGVDWKITSLEYILAEQSISIAKGVVLSLVTLLLLTFLVLLITSRSLTLGLLGVIPNVLPLITVFGAMGMSLEHLDIGTALVASCSLGLTIDHTVHFILSFCAHRSRTPSVRQSVDATLSSVAPTFIASSITLIVVFACLAASEVSPVSNFAYFLAVALFSGLIADLTIFPLSLRIFARHPSDSR